MTSPLERRAILLGVTGGIACYKACDLASRLVRRGAVVDVVMTPAAAEFVRPLTFAALTGRSVHVDLWATVDRKPGHIALAERPALAVVAPATFNTIGKMALGLADNLLTSIFSAYAGKLLLAPALNSGMWANPAFQHNLNALKERGARVVGPGTGRLACGAEGVGRMAEPEEIVQAAEAWLAESGTCLSVT